MMNLKDDFMASMGKVIKNIFIFYFEGFRTLSSWGRQAWLIILIKLFIMFVLLKIFFFPDFLKTNFKNDKERSNYVIEQLTGNK